ncbi:cuticle protein LPCP-23-like, partial [Lucilia cuprina]|uniref:cuticle protein LPCP-23-like n=1 Tax=Lucilia cuprina TaxID=7375 RepID=UPI001F0518B0
VVLFALLAVAAARPSLVESPVVYSAPADTVTVQETGYAHVGNVVKSVPSAISHHSNAVVHSTAHTVEDVVAPAVKTTEYTTKTLATPVVESYAVAPTVVKTVESAPLVHSTVAATPLVQSVATPVVHTYAAAAPVLHSYAAPVTTYAASSPLTYTATGVW